MTEERFTPREDPRPDDVHWPVAQWPPPPGIHLRGTWVELTPATTQDAHGLRMALDHDHVWQHLVGGPLPDGPTDPAAVIDLLAAQVEPGLMALGSGRFFGWVIGGLVAACIGTYALVSTGAPALLGLPMLAFGVTFSALGVVLAGRTSVRTNYRPDPWRLPEWAVSAAGVTVAMVFAASDWLGVPGLHTSVDPAAWPTIPLAALAGILVATTPAWTAPRLPEGAAWSGAPRERRAREQVPA